MTQTKQFRIIASATSKNYTIIFDSMETYFIFYNSELIDTVTDATNPVNINKEVENNTYKDIKENTNIKLVKVLIRHIETTFNKNADKTLVLNTLIVTLKNAYNNEKEYNEQLKNTTKEIQEFIMEKSINYGFDNPLLDSDLNKGDNERFNKIFLSHNNNWQELYKTELYDYVDNEENIFKGVINSLSALFGYGSRFIVVNGGAEVGKSEYIETIKKLMPYFENLGSSTPASIRRKDEYYFNKKIIYLGDKGLKGTDNEEFKGLQEVFGGLITDKEFIRDVVEGDKVVQYNLKSDGVCVFYSEPYTNLKIFGAGEQYTTRSSFITVNPVKDGLGVFLQDETKTNAFYGIHKEYIRYILNNPVELKLSKEVLTKIYQASRESLRTAKYLKSLFKAYCQYMQLGNPLISDADAFLNVFKPEYEITDIEFEVYKKLYENLNVLSKDGLEYKIFDDGGIKTDDMLLQRKDRKYKSFFTAKQIQTYFKYDFKMNKNLKDTIDQIPMILNNLFNAGLINRIETQHNNQDVFYIPKKEDMDK